MRLICLKSMMVAGFLKEVSVHNQRNVAKVIQGIFITSIRHLYLLGSSLTTLDESEGLGEHPTGTY